MEDLVELKQARVVRPRPPTLTSIPALLSTFQNEWDALILETYQLKQQLAETRQELSTALYYSDSAEKVIARLQQERDEARDALAKISVTSTSNGANGDAMQVDGQGLPEAIVAKIEQTQAEYVCPETAVFNSQLLIHCLQTVINTTKAPDSRRLGNSRLPAEHAVYSELGTTIPRRPLDCSRRNWRPCSCWRKRRRGWCLLGITRTGHSDIEVRWWLRHRCRLVGQQARDRSLDWCCQDVRQRSRGCQLRPPCGRRQRTCPAPLRRHPCFGWCRQELRPLRLAVTPAHYSGLYRFWYVQRIYLTEKRTLTSSRTHDRRIPP